MTSIASATSRDRHWPDDLDNGRSPQSELIFFSAALEADRHPHRHDDSRVDASSRSAPNESGAAGQPARHFQILSDNGSVGSSQSPTASNGPGQPPLVWNPETEDPPLPAPSPYGDEYDALTSGVNDQAATAAGLAAPLNAATTLFEHWFDWNLDSIDWSHPPSTLPPEATDALAMVESNPALLNAMKSGEDGPVTHDSLGALVGQAGADLSQATKDFQAWQRTNPDAGKLATSLAQSAALLEANATLLSTSSGSGLFSVASLTALANQNPGLSASLKGAAQMWAHPGMLKQIDQAGQSYLSAPDGLVDAGNIRDWLETGAPGSQSSAMDLLNQAAAREATSGVDTSQLGADVLAHPENYSAEQKAAVLQSLEDIQERMGLDSQTGTINSDLQQQAGINPNIAKTYAELQGKIDQLSQDKDVVALLANRSGGDLQSIVNADSDVKAAIQSSLSDFTSGATLNADLSATDLDGHQVSQTDALHSFVAQAGFFELALGQNGQPTDSLDLSSIAKASGQYQSILDAYNNNIVSGNDMRAAVNTGASPTDVAEGFAEAVQAYNAVLDPADVAKAAPDLQTNYRDTMTNATLSSLTSEDFLAALSDANGNLDEDKLNSYVKILESTDPGIIASDSNDVANLFSVLRNVFNIVRYGGQITNALKGLGFLDGDHPAAKGLLKAMSTGTMHGVAGVLSGIALASKIGGGFPSDPSQAAAFCGSGVAAFGLMVNAGGRAYNTLNPWVNPAAAQATSDLDTAQTALSTAEDERNKAVQAQSDAEKNLDTAKADLDKASSALKDAQAELQAQRDQLAKVDSGYVHAANDADAKLASAQDQLNDAQAGLASANQTLDRANHTRDGAKSTLDEADGHLRQLTQQESLAAKASDQARLAYQKAKVTEQEHPSEANHTALQHAGEVRDQAAAKLQEIRKQTSDAQGNVDRAQAAWQESAGHVADAEHGRDAAQNSAGRSEQRVQALQHDKQRLDSDHAAKVDGLNADIRDATTKVNMAEVDVSANRTSVATTANDAAKKAAIAQSKEIDVTNAEATRDGAKTALDDAKRTPPPFRNRINALGTGISGLGSFAGGISGIIFGTHQKASGDIEKGNINIASGSLALISGTMGTIEGGINLAGKGVSIKNPFGTGGSFGEVISLANGVLDGAMTIGGVVLTMVGWALDIQDKKKTVDTETAKVDADLQKFGITGGEITQDDINSVGPLADGLPAPPDTWKPPPGSPLRN